ncbi:MAG: DUF6391 domain-containing protein [Chloroflexi bacterium]|nr:DUF6391 domain-containing protein [Chloroflexota bacterium]
MPAFRLNSLRSILSQPVILRIRRNHGLEHATLTVLAQRNPRRAVAGYSDWNGFWLAGNLTPEEVESAVEEALRRVNGGERGLVVHPHCGTNYVASGVLAAGAALLAMAGSGRRLRDQLARLPMAAALATLATIVAYPLGFELQRRATTSADLQDLAIKSVRQTRRGKTPAIRVLTEQRRGG